METIRTLLGNATDTSHATLLAYVLEKPREWMLAHPEAAVHHARVARFRVLRNRLRRGEPLAQMIGEQWFYGRPFTVTRDVLIPRPESELVVSLELRAIENLKFQISNYRPRIIDVGTGSGCLAVTLAAELPHAHVIAIDISPTALRVAQRNAQRNGVSNRIHFLCGDLLQPYYTQKYDRNFGCSHNVDAPIFIISNPPYLTTAEWRALPRSLKSYEPRAAFDGGRDGLKYYRELFTQMKTISLIHDSLFIILEIDPRRKVALANIIRTMLPGWQATWHRDLARRWRVLELTGK